MNGSKPIIVVVEDEFVIAASIQEILEQEGYEVVINIATYSKAIEIINKLKPQLVLIDINLIGIKDGIDIGSYMLQYDKIPFLYLTSMSDSLTIDRAKHTRPMGYIVKPFSPSILISNIAIVLHNFKHRNLDVIRNNIPVSNDVTFQIKKALNFIDLNLSDPITVDTLSKLTKWQAAHFARIFKSQIGKTPYNYLADKRIEKACVYLSNNDLTIAAIATEVGFESSSSFCTAFKKSTNQTPESYRLTNFLRL